MYRPCQVCGSSRHRELYNTTFSTGDEQVISVCIECGMVYASETPQANYSTKSIYAAKDATGSGDSPYDKEKFKGTVDILYNHFKKASISILDVGCAQGGLLAELKSEGYHQSVGLDPSEACVAICHKKSLAAFCSTVESEPIQQYDLAIMSHVLEHVWDVPTALFSLSKWVKEGGHVYIEVPNAVRYAETTIPFLDFNREHINHFSLAHLTEVLHRHGFGVIASGERTLSNVNGGKYPAMYVIAKKGASLELGIREYVKKSQQQMNDFSESLKPRIANRDIILWGFGELAQQLFLTEAVRSANIIQVVDSDQGKHGLTFNGKLVESPDAIKSDEAILVASILSAWAIEYTIRNRGLTNEVILL